MVLESWGTAPDVTERFTDTYSLDFGSKFLHLPPSVAKSDISAEV